MNTLACGGVAEVDRRAIWLGVLAVGGFLVMATGIILVPRVLYPPLSSGELRGVSSVSERIQLQQAQSRLANDARSALLQGFAGLLVVGGAAATWRQVHVSREGQITERLTRAVDQLGTADSYVRIGGIYALERIGRNSAADRDTVQWLLGAFIRMNAPWPTEAGQLHPTETVDEQLPWMRIRAPEIQAAMSVLGRRARTRDEQSLYLSRVDLRSIALRRARLDGAQLRYSNLARAVLVGVRLDGGDLKGADLRRANLEGAQLSRADLSGAYLQGANLRGADLSQVNLRGTNLSEVILDGAVLAGAQADQTTIWPAGMDGVRRRDLGVIDVGHQEA